jgi:hypothetical protein
VPSAPALFRALLLELPGELPYARPPSATAPRYFELLEQNTHLVYPALAVLVVTLIALGVIAAWRSGDVDGIEKAEVKRELVRELRRELHGVTVDQLARTLGVPSLKLLRLLEELAEQGIAECRTDTRRVTTWRLKGLVA